MTRDDIIALAREAGELKCDCCLPYYEETDIEGFEGFLERFAALVYAAGAAAEREECVKVCESVKAQCEANAGGYIAQEDAYAISAVAECVTVIRARGSK